MPHASTRKGFRLSEENLTGLKAPMTAEFNCIAV